MSERQRHSLRCWPPALLSPILIACLVSPGPCQAVRSGAPTLPPPTGRRKMGTVIFHLSDQTRRNDPDSSAGSSRDLTVQVWYPARNSSAATAAPYIADRVLIAAMQKAEYMNLSSEVLETWSKIATHAVLDAPIAARPRRLPLLFFSHGLGMSRSNYTSIIEDLASHETVVVAIDHPSTGFTLLPDGSLLALTAPPAAAIRRSLTAGALIRWFTMPHSC